MNKKKILISIVFFVFFFPISLAHAELKEKLINNIKNTQTLFFNFKQKISENVEVGNCYIKYPMLIKCDYNDSFKKRLISNGKTLAIIQRRYKKIFYYRLKNTPLYFILDKKFLINFIEKNEPTNISNFSIEFEIRTKNKKKIIIIFDRDSLNLKGWNTSDLYNNKVEFSILNLKTNILIDNNNFKIPKEEDL